MSEVKRRICHVCAGMPREYFCGVCDQGRDYEALAAQRDEGLAREAEYKAQHRRDVHTLDKLSQIETDLLNTQHELALFMDGYTGQWQAREALQKRLAKAQEILAKAIYLQWYDEPGYVPWVEGGESLRQFQAREEAMEQLRDVGCADGEKQS